METLIQLFIKLLYPERYNIFLIIKSLWIYFIIVIFVILYIILFRILAKDYRITKQFKNTLEIEHQDNDAIFFNYIHYKYYIKNVFDATLNIILYLSFTIIFYLALRLYFIGQYKSLNLTTYSQFTLNAILAVTPVILFIAIYALFTQTILYTSILQLHLYFCNYYWKNLLAYRANTFVFGNIWHAFFAAIASKANYILDADTRKFFLKFKQELYKGYSKEKIEESERSKPWYLRSNEPLYHKYKNQTKLVTTIYIASQWLSVRGLFYLKETAWLTVFVALLYDISQKELHYIYFASLIFILRKSYSKIADTLLYLDGGWDNILHEYMYKTPYMPDIKENAKRIDYFKNKVLSEEQKLEYNNYFTCVINQWNLYQLRENLIPYLTSGLNTMDSSSKTQINANELEKVKTRMIFISYLGIIYILMTQKVVIEFFNIFSLNLSYILSIFFILLFYFWVHPSFKHKIIFWVISLSLITFTFFIYLTHNLPLLFIDIIYDSSYIKIINYYTPEEKLEYFIAYLNYLLDIYHVKDKVYILNILSDSYIGNLVMHVKHLQEIKVYVEAIVQAHLHLEAIYLENFKEIVLEVNQKVLEIQRNFFDLNIKPILIFITTMVASKILLSVLPSVLLATLLKHKVYSLVFAILAAKGITLEMTDIQTHDLAAALVDIYVKSKPAIIILIESLMYRWFL